jgi:hypothetical protein
VTAAAGLQPASSRGLMRAPELPKVAAARTAMARPAEVDDRGMAFPFTLLLTCL